MHYRPKYSQPFTLSQAMAFDVETITGGIPTLYELGICLKDYAEIARLQDSLHRLNETQVSVRRCAFP
jgi:hypothetical protein